MKRRCLPTVLTFFMTATLCMSRAADSAPEVAAQNPHMYEIDGDPISIGDDEIVALDAMWSVSSTQSKLKGEDLNWAKRYVALYVSRKSSCRNVTLAKITPGRWPWWMMIEPAHGEIFHSKPKYDEVWNISACKSDVNFIVVGGKGSVGVTKISGDLPQ